MFQYGKYHLGFGLAGREVNLRVLQGLAKFIEGIISH